MSIIAFGDELLRTQDLDPVYVAIHGAAPPYVQRLRLCLAYWSFYHLGLAAWMSEAKTPATFWKRYEAAVINTDLVYPRGSERRHFRGHNAMSAYAHLRKTYKTPELAALGLIGNPQRPSFAAVSKSVQSHVGFGPWIAFKIADMAERVLSCQVDFSDCELGIYKDPRQGAAVACLEAFYPGSLNNAGSNLFANNPWDYPITQDELGKTVDHYVRMFRKMKHRPPAAPDRPVNVQEIETIFCKYKSHLKGHYPMGKDTHEIGLGLRRYANSSDTAAALLGKLPK